MTTATIKTDLIKITVNENTLTNILNSQEWHPEVKASLEAMIEEANRKATTVQLIGLGRVNAKKASEVKAGENMMFNYGSTALILNKKTSTSGKTVEFTLADTDKGTMFTRRIRIDTLVPIKELN